MAKNKSLKKGDAKALSISHPNSRKAKALSKKMIKTTMRQKTKMEYAIKRNIFGEKLLWFRDNIESVEEYTPTMFNNVFQRYLSRFDDELEQIEIKHSIGQRKSRQHANREDIINMTVKRDFEEYNTCGIEMVDLLNKKQLKMFRGWDGEMGFINQFTIRRFSKLYLENLSNQAQSKGTAKSVNGQDDEEMTTSEDNQDSESGSKTEVSTDDSNLKKITEDVEMDRA